MIKLIDFPYWIFPLSSPLVMVQLVVRWFPLFGAKDAKLIIVVAVVETMFAFGYVIIIVAVVVVEQLVDVQVLAAAM